MKNITLLITNEAPAMVQSIMHVLINEGYQAFTCKKMENTNKYFSDTVQGKQVMDALDIIRYVRTTCSNTHPICVLSIAA